MSERLLGHSANHWYHQHALRTLRLDLVLLAAASLWMLVGCSKGAKVERVMQLVTSPGWPEPIARIPIPSNWKFESQHQPGEPTVVGPDGLTVVDVPLQMFIFSNDRMMRRAYRKGGQTLRRFGSVDEVLAEDFVPQATRGAKTLVNSYPLPELAQYDTRYNAQLFQAVPAKNRYPAVAAEWKDTEGNPSLTITRFNISEGQGLQIWGYYTHILEAPPDRYEQAKGDLLFALLNTEHNRAFIADHNRKEQQKSAASWKRHNQKMRTRQRNFDAQQRAFRENSDAINDSIMNGWRERNAASDRMQEKTVDTIHEEQDMRDPSSGQTYKVESGAKQYWNNGQGEYIKSEDLFYNPNRDPSVNHQDWNEMEPEP